MAEQHGTLQGHIVQEADLCGGIMVPKFTGGGVMVEQDPTVPAWAKQLEKPKYTADEVGAISKDMLGEAIDDALAQAKESGEFDGKDGKDGKDGQDGYTPVKGID